ncbi:MAG: ABC transporter ATP-binding protein [Clostridiales bacterium]|nr:ABC transporter ATP-binding protein [Clostridiales bacterium]
MKDYYFRAESLSVGYQGKTVIEKIKFGIKKGEILTLIGPNGAGKSTILKSIAGQLAPIAGTVFIGQRDLSMIGQKELAKELAVVFTKRLHTEMMTCEDVVAAGRYPYTGKFGILSEEDYRAVEDAMTLVQVEDLRNRDFTKISDGQRQRVLLARAIAQQPDIILLDEPTSYLDVKYKLEFLNALQQMAKQRQLSVIMSLHELDLAERISDKILCVGGQIVDKFGTPEEIFVPGYIGRLFGITSGSFEENTGNLELEPPKGEAGIFVIAGGGTGKEVYRRLQRERLPFVAGILFENDIDYPVAKALGAHVIAEASFQKIRAERIEEAKGWVDRCDIVICCKNKFGDWDRENEFLEKYAKEQGKRVEKPEKFFHNRQET